MINLLILCTANSARSILAEAVFNARGGARLHAFSAGSKPAGAVNPHALALLLDEGIDITGLRSKSWEEFERPGAPVMDAVITVCDSAASEACPVWPGAPVRTHWGLPDPAGVEPEDAASAAFKQTYHSLAARIDHVLACTHLGDRAALARALGDAHDRAAP
jgi:arsenate reductase